MSLLLLFDTQIVPPAPTDIDLFDLYIANSGVPFFNGSILLGEYNV